VVGWLAVFGLLVLGPIAVRWAVPYLQARGAGLLTAAKAIMGALGAISGAVTLRAGHGAGTPAKADSRTAPMTLGLALAAPVFIVSLFIVLALAGTALIAAVLNPVARTLVLLRVGGDPTIPVTLLVSVGLILFGIATASRIDTNKFSLHAVYRARLIRAYLGASREAGQRDPNAFTGFDEDDNLPLREIWMPAAHGGHPAGFRGNGPLHIVNVALNLVGGTNLAWQERKAESFTMSPLYCGATSQGYRPVRRPPDTMPQTCYGGVRGISLGTAVTISGAAASPNMGYHSSPVISFLLTLFNVRLGWWLGNSGYAGREVYHRSSPTSSLQLLFDEALAKTDDRHPYVYLSDGGHFENLGLYEMVLRRCHTIMVSDAGCDPCGTFEDLGNAIRKIRVDFGIPISFRTVPIYSRSDDGSAPPGSYCAIGTIEYSRVDGPGTPDGTLIYIKPAFYGREPTDVLNYARTTREFPHESTADQFFSESQFESYRALGSFIIDQMAPPPQLPLEAEEAIVKSSLNWFVRQARDYLNGSPAPNPVDGVAGVTVTAGPRVESPR